MITGYNTDVSHHGLVLHVQTEDKGIDVASIESLVYMGGQILGKRRTSYREVLSAGESKAAIVDLMDRQHRLMIAEIRNGHYDEELAEQGLISPEMISAAGAATDAMAPVPIVEDEPAPVTLAAGDPEPGAAGQSLDEIILEYLNSEAEQEHLVLMMEVNQEFALGEAAELYFRTKASVSGEPVPGTQISVRMISTVAEPATLAYGETDAKGELRLDLEVPDLRRGSSALIVTASSHIGTAEIKHLL